jgi:hypothetical protein
VKLTPAQQAIVTALRGQHTLDYNEIIELVPGVDAMTPVRRRRLWEGLEALELIVVHRDPYDQWHITPGPKL